MLGAAALTGIGISVLGSPSSAFASVYWTHPFLTRRSVPVDGEYGNYAAWRQAQNLGRHSGVDLDGPFGMDVYNCAVGTVTWAGWGNGQGSWGRWVEVLHADGTKTGYSHLSGVNVSIGQNLNGPTVIGRVGGSGGSGDSTYSPHLHLTRYTGTIATRHDPTFLVYADLPVPGQAPPDANGDIEMRTIFNLDGANDATRRATIGELTFTVDTSSQSTVERMLWGVPVNVSQTQWDALKAGVNARRTAAGLPPV
jgi:murein DD-endopeptidase MepM/ murein hydrolase activator NlpD